MASERNGTVLRQIQTLFVAGTYTGLTDGQLLDRFLAGRDEAAFSVLVDRHGPMVLRVCRAVLRDLDDSDDAFQATFLVLARRAASIRARGSVGSWLFGVASRVASCARSAAARRRTHERRSAERAAGPGVDSGSADEDDCSAVQVEVGRLPERFRGPVVLCYLEGWTCEEAAGQLGLPVGTVKSRLARGRERLRGRLGPRGLAPSVVGFGRVLFPERFPAAVPVGLGGLTVRSALGVAAGKSGAAGAVPVAVAGLMEGALKTMRIHKMMMVGGLLLAVGIAAGGVGLIASRASGGPPAEPPEKTSPSKPFDPSSPEHLERIKENEKRNERLRKEWAERRTEQDLLEIDYEVRKSLYREALTRLGQLDQEHALGHKASRDDRQEREQQRQRLVIHATDLRKRILEIGVVVNLEKLPRRESPQ